MVCAQSACAHSFQSLIWQCDGHVNARLSFMPRTPARPTLVFSHLFSRSSSPVEVLATWTQFDGTWTRYRSLADSGRFWGSVKTTSHWETLKMGPTHSTAKP